MRWFFLGYAYEPGLRPDSGGFRKLWEVARALTTLGHECRVFYPRLPGFVPLRDVPSHAYPVVDRPLARPLSAHVAMAAAALRAARRARPDVVYFRSHLNPLPLPVARSIRARMVVEVNADTAAFMRQVRTPPWKTRLFSAVERVNVRAADLVVATTPGLAGMVVERYRISRDRVCVVPSGTDPDHFAPRNPDACRVALGIDSGRPVVGFVGLFYRHQGVPTLLAALARLRAALPGILGLVVGDGVMRADWEARARALALGDAVRFTGQVPYGEVPAYLGAMDVVAAPFTGDRGEASPFKVLDALACERPVVASDIPSMRPLASESGGVTLVPPDDPDALAGALRALVTDAAAAARMGRRGRAFVVERHAWTALAERLCGFLASRSSRV